jgi:glucose/arabinose dehydrogenase
MHRLWIFTVAFVTVLLIIFVASYFLIINPFLSAYGPSPVENPQEGLSTLSMPKGFSAEIYAEVKGARSLAYDAEKRILYVGTRQEGQVYAVMDEDQDYTGDRIMSLASNLDMPNGVALRNDTLYVAEVGRILAFENISESLSGPTFEVITSDYPEEAQHGWKFIKFGPDNQLYVPVGAPCNICESEKPFSTITRLNVTSGEYEIHAEGIRNTVGFDWDPLSDDLWFTDNGRDWLGDNLPPDELNHITAENQHFGYPYCHGNSTIDPEFGYEGACSQFRAPEQELGPHVAALGMEFYDGKQLPEHYSHDILIAEHGSWNREDPIGYRISHVDLNEAREAQNYTTLISGWLQGERSWGRPVDIEVLPDGSFLVSDDKAGVIYRFTYTG